MDNFPIGRINNGITTAKTAMGNSGLLFTQTPAGTSYVVPRNVEFPTFETYPFQVSVYKKEDGNWYASIVPGTINSLVPLIGNSSGADGLMTSPTKPELQINFSNNQSFIYIKSGNAGYTWPDDNFNNTEYPRIKTGVMPADSDDYGHFLIATVSKNPNTQNVFVSQFIKKIIWSERHKFTEPNSAYYIYWTL